MLINKYKYFFFLILAIFIDINTKKKESLLFKHVLVDNLFLKP